MKAVGRAYLAVIWMEMTLGIYLPDLEVCGYPPSSPEYKILPVTSRERQLDPSEVLRRDSGKGQLKPMHMKRK